MSFVDQSIIKHKVGLLNLAEELRNVSQACRLMGVSRDTFYRVKEAKEEGLVLTETQLQALERRRQEQLECGEIETAHPGYLGSQDTFYVGNMKGVGRIYQIAFRKKLYSSLEELQKDLDSWLRLYNDERTHQGKMCCGRTPMATFEEGIRICRQKTVS